MSDRLPLHAQPTADRRLWGTRSAGADLCARKPALWSRMVRYQDQLEAEGWPKVAAGQIAWAYYVGTRPP